MGQIDTVIRYGRHNTYKLDPNETLYSDPYEVSLYSAITSQLVAIKPGGTATGEIGIRWIDEQNKRMGNDEIFPFDVSDRFSDFWRAIDVPEGASKVQWWVKAGPIGFHFGCPKVGPGTLPTAYSDDLAERVAWHTVDGSYVHLLSADQIVAGVLRSVVGDAGFDLDNSRIWMTGEDGAKWTASPESPLKITNSEGEFVGGLRRVKDALALVASAITGQVTDEIDIYADIGEFPSGIIDGNSYRGLNCHVQNNAFFIGLDRHGALVITVNGKQVFYSLPGVFSISSAMREDFSHFFKLAAAPVGSIGERVDFKINGDNMFAFVNYPNTYPVRTGLEVNRKDGSFNSQMMVMCNANQMFLKYDKFPNHEIGIDSGGPYYVKDGVKKYHP